MLIIHAVLLISDLEFIVRHDSPAFEWNQSSGDCSPRLFPLSNCHFINPFSAAGKFAAKLACFATKHLFEGDSYRVQSLSIAVIRGISSVCNVFE